MQLKNKKYVKLRKSTKQRVLKLERMPKSYLFGAGKSKIVRKPDPDSYDPARAGIERSKLKKRNATKHSMNRVNLAF